MKTMNLRRRHLAALLLGALLVVSGASLAESGEQQTIRGEVEPADYDEDGFVSRVGIYDEEWGWVLISHQGKGKELLEHVGAVAKVSGTIVEPDAESGGDRVMRVTDFSIEEPAEPTDDPDDWDPEE